ncbi:anillin isoform X2 [Dendroctonus ponderosae]|uniref:anillin isoform X2 n=1 Tax=Dendroctonus ponderosae TaxID=77166 RepID=UPI0020362D12|nr:anillin isoform X2 [Dendroctonus ponderosae]
MDAFTENILARARERQRLLQGAPNAKVSPLRESNKNAVSEPDLTEVKKIPPRESASESSIPYKLSQAKEGTLEGSPGQQTKTLNIQRDSFNMEIKVNSADNVRLEVAIEECSDDGNNGSNENFGLREESKHRLKRLGKLYAGGDEADISSPIHRTEAKFYESIANDREKDNPRRYEKPKKGLNKLAELANNINQWEDDLSHHGFSTEHIQSPTKKNLKAPAPQPPIERGNLSPTKCSPVKFRKAKAPSPPNNNFTNDQKSSAVWKSPGKEVLTSQNSASETTQSAIKCFLNNPESGQAGGVKKPSNSEATPKRISWDKKVLDSLESQGFSRTQSSSRLVYAYNSQNSTRNDAQVKSDAQFKEQGNIPDESSEKLLPGKHFENDDKYLEQNKKTNTPDYVSNTFKSGAIANRAAMFEQKAHETSVKPQKDPALLSLADRKALFEKNKGEALVPKAAFGMSAPVKVDTTTKACESKFIGIVKNKENVVQIQRNRIEANKGPIIVSETVKAQQPSKPNYAASRSKTKSTPPPPPPAQQFKAATSSTSKVASIASVTVPTVAAVYQAGGIASKMAALLENKNKATISEEQIANKMKQERQKELDMLLNRFNQNKQGLNEGSDVQSYNYERSASESSDDDEVDERTAMIKETVTVQIESSQSRKSAEKRKSGSRLSNGNDSPQVASVLDEVKRIKVSPPKAGRLYPCLSDIEATTTDQDTRTPTPNEENSFGENNCDSDDPNTSFGRDIIQAVCKNITPSKKVTYKECSSSSENSCVIDELDEILEEMEEDSSAGPTPPKHGRHISPNRTKPQPSNSFHYKSFNSSSSSPPSAQKSKFQSPNKSIISPRQSTELPLIVDGEQVLPLTHTVSFYRKQQNEVHTPIRHIIRQPVIEEDIGSVEEDKVQKKMELLQQEVNRQQNIIAQTSQALNLCSSTPEFSGSTEQVEAERVLLVASHRRQAALHELQRLKVEGNIRPMGKHSENVPLEKGTLTISNIVLPMKQKYVTALAAAGGKGHHVVCLIKCCENVVPTKLVSTVANASNPDVDLYIPGSVTLNDIYSDFTLTFEVYCLQAQEECLPHDVKYHINKKSSKGLVTPKKGKHDSRLLMPPKESPGGPQAVRTSSFALMGYVIFSIQAVSKRVWSLNNTPAMSPLEGSVEMKITCELAVSVEHRGFLTMFEDISGFGAWHRRWCLLKGNTFSYWKYPDDERKMAPIDTIDLTTCITKQVAPVSRDICARLHTFLLERERPACAQDKDTLVIVRKGDKTIIRHLLSADTKEERILWCTKLNSALIALRMWGSTQ